MPLKDIRVGMTGYGMTVFHGSKITPFPFEVMSVEADFSPRRPVIWVRCKGEQMLLTGPVSGMSGSPMYLWPKGAEKKLGKNGLLVGAFAYGYSMGKDSFAGVQPIELMRNVGKRAHNPPEGDAPTKGNLPWQRPGQQLRHLISTAEQMNVPSGDLWRAKALAEILDPDNEFDPRSEKAKPNNTVRAPHAKFGEIKPMLLPFNVGSRDMARLLEPVLEPMGFMPMRVPNGTMAGKPPAGIDAEKIRFAPGSVITLPLAYGDMDLSASGTVTDVLPDGTVLAFGHAMFGQGPVKLPVATGFVHFIQPSIMSSFKMSGSNKIAGTLVRDENSAVVAIPGGEFHTSPVKVSVKFPNAPLQKYNYKVAHHAQFTPMLVGQVAAMSINAIRELPIESTLKYRGTLVFEGGRKYTFSRITPGGNPFGLFFALSPTISGMVNNSFKETKLVSAEIHIDVEMGIQSASLIATRMEDTEAAPGGTIAVNLKYREYRKKPFERRIKLKLPDNLPDGNYSIALTNASGYNNYLTRFRPHRTRTEDVDDIIESSQALANVRDDALYAVLQLPKRGLAIGRTELPQLPDSRAVLIASPTRSGSSVFSEHWEQIIPMGFVPSGSVTLNIAVRKDLKK